MPNTESAWHVALVAPAYHGRAVRWPIGMKGVEMSRDEVAAPSDGAASMADPPPVDFSVAHQARVYDYLLGGRFPLSTY
jgi:hypothetical protein